MAASRPLAIIAAAGPGMGLAIAKRFARESYNIALLARDKSALTALKQELFSFDVATGVYAVDLCDTHALNSAFATIRQDFGAAEVMIYNGGAWHEIPAMQFDPDVFSRDLMLCITAGLVCAQNVYTDMKEAGRGTILFTGGGLALYPEYGAGVSSLTAGKAGLRALTYALAKEIAADGIHVGTVTIAGTVKTDTAFDPDLIAERYWALHCEPPSSWTVETIHDGK